MRFLLGVAGLQTALSAHMVSISTSELSVDGAGARFELRMPLYEAEALEEPGRELFEHLRLSSGGTQGRLASLSCSEDRPKDTFTCLAEYEFPGEVEALEVECAFYKATVPNHVHILRARRGEAAIQEIFDLTASKAEINFIPPTLWEVVSQQVGAGSKRALGGAASLLFLFALVIASRRRAELFALAGMFAAGQLVASIVAPLLNWQPAPRFVEAAAALTIAYLAVEVLLLPEAGQRGLVVGVLGLFHGLYLELFVRETMFSPLYVLPGAIVAELAAIGLLAVVWAKLAPALAALRPVKSASVLLFLFGMSWFFLRLQG